MADPNLNPPPDRDKRMLLAQVHLMQARWLAAEKLGGPRYSEQLDEFLARMCAADIPPELIGAARRVLAGGSV